MGRDPGFEQRGPLSRALGALERVGNRLPEPVTLFVLLALLVVIASALAARAGIQVLHPKDGTPSLVESGANFLKGMGFGEPVLMVGLVLVTAFLNLFTSSASARWATMAPVFVPLFVLLGFTPEGTQLIYRIGDSSTNIITPLTPYMRFILAYVKRYDPAAGMGTVIAMMIPYSVAFLASWTLLLLAWDALRSPIGPGVLMHRR